MIKRALCIGINAYPDARDKLSGCVNDARDWQSALVARGFEATLLLDAQATKARMIEGIERLVHGLASGDLAALTYAGHGSQVDDEDGDERDTYDEVLCPVDVGEDRPLADDEIGRLFAARARGVRVVFISDSCHSGTVSRARPQPLPGEPPPRPRWMPTSRFRSSPERARDLPVGDLAPRRRKVSRRDPECLLLAGCQDREVSYDASFDGRPNGAFSYAALGALRALREGATYTQWLQAIHLELPSPRHPQRPNMLGKRAERGSVVWA